jgi:hypothetical protein
MAVKIILILKTSPLIVCFPQVRLILKFTCRPPLRPDRGLFSPAGGVIWLLSYLVKTVPAAVAAEREGQNVKLVIVG